MPAVLLRLLLCASLLLNGIGSAVAATHMAMPSGSDAMTLHAAHADASVQPAETTAAGTGSDCRHHAPQATAPTQPMPHDDINCMQSCLAMCMHHCHALPPVMLSFALPAFADGPLTGNATEPRIAPAPPPVRPPIA